MKRKLLFTLLTGLGTLGLMAQSQKPFKYVSKVDPAQDQPAVYNKKTFVGTETFQGAQLKSGGGNQAASLNGPTVGTTTYDLQTNASTQNRLVRHADGTISAVWTLSTAGTLAAPDRGTGYNYYNGTAWGAAPTTRIESQRGGWPSIAKSGANGEINTLHNTDAGVITQSRRTTKGAGTWTQTNITDPNLDVLWNRMASGGTNNNSIHMIGITAPVANSGSVYQGLDGALMYYRSLDGGLTYDIQGQVLPGLTSNDWLGFTGDSYSITSRGNTVAFAIFNDWADVIIMKSIDNGTTWTKTVVMDFPIDKYAIDQGIDMDNDGAQDTVLSSDQSGSIIIDNNGKVHVWFGLMRYLDDDLTDGTSSYFPLTDGLAYWNEDFGTDNIMLAAEMPDLDGDGQISFVGTDNTTVGQYFFSTTSMPYASIDANGDMFVIYSVVMETLSNFAQNYRHIFAMRSNDGGCTWSEGVDITPNESFVECVFGSTPSEIGSDNKIHVIYQEDDEPGLAVRGDQDAFQTNNIIYLNPATSTIPNVASHCASGIKAGALEFCTGDSVMLSAICGTAYAWKNSAGTTVGTSQDYYATTQGTYTVDITTACGVQTETVTLTAPVAAPTVSASATELQICPGTQTTLSVTEVSLGTYAWSSGGSAATEVVAQPGTYTVTVTNCGGTSTAQVIISLPNQPTATVTGDAFICGNGDAATFSVNSSPSATYAWSTNESTQSISVNAVGTYTVTVTNCAGTANASFTVSTEPAPVATLTASATSVCFGQSIVLTADGGLNYLWSNGATTSAITLSQVSESGTYTVVAENSCGVTNTSAGTAVSINPIPPTPNVTYSNGVFSSSASTGNQWYLNGSPVAGETNQTYTPNGEAINGAQVFVVVTVSGCSSDPSAVTVSVNNIETLKNAIVVYPNPNNGQFSVDFRNVQAGNYNMNITNIIGQSVYAKTIAVNGTQTNQLDLSTVAKGVYLVKISDGTNEAVQRMVIQ